MQLLQAPSFLKVQGRSLLAEGRILSPSKIENILLAFKSGSNGFVSIKPRIRFLDANGKFFDRNLPSGILVTSPILEFLSDEFNTDYTVKRLAPTYAGWRALMDVANGSKISRNQVYGDSRYGHHLGKQLEALLRSGLVESRIFPGERGRGGQILKLRLAFTNDTTSRLAGTQLLSKEKNTTSGARIS